MPLKQLYFICVLSVSTALTWAGDNNWWTSFQDSSLSYLMKKTFENNGDYEAMRQRTTQADAQEQRAKALLYPMVNITGQYNRASYTPTAGMPPTTTEAPDAFTKGDLYLNARYSVDVWGQGWQKAQAAKLMAKAAKQDVNALALNLGTRVVIGYFDVVYTKSLIEITERQIQASQDILTTAKSRFRSGQYSLLPVLQQEQALAQAQTQLPPARSKLREGMELLRVLTGVPRRELRIGTRLLNPKNLKIQDVTKTVDARPDLAATHLRLQAAKHLETAAKWAYAPSLEISGRAGLDYVKIDSTVRDEKWAIGASLTMPLFGGFSKGASRRDARASRLATQYSLSQARIQANGDISFAQQREAEVKSELTAHLNHKKAAEKAYNEARERFRQGLAEYLDVLSTQNALFQSEKNVLRARLMLVLARLETIRVTGGNLK